MEIVGFAGIGNVNAGPAGAAVFADAEAVVAALPLTVTANLASGGTLSVPVAAWVNTDGYNPAVQGSYTFTATLGALPKGYVNSGSHTATVEVVVGAAAALSSITVTASPTKISYKPGEAFSAAGLVLTAAYSNNTTATVSNGYALTWNGSAIANGNTAITANTGTKTIIVTFQGKTATFGITVTSGGSSDVEADAWLWDKQTIFTVTDGVASESYHIEATHPTFHDATHYTMEYTYMIPQNSVEITETYTRTQTWTDTYDYSWVRNGNRGEMEYELIRDGTTTDDYVNPDIDDTTTTTHLTMTLSFEYTYCDGTDILAHSKTYTEQQYTASEYSYSTTGTGESTFFEDTGIMSKTVGQGTNNGTPINSTTEYTIILLGESGGVKEYKVYDSSTDGTQTYTVYKIKNGVRLEAKSYSSGALYSTMTQTFPTDTTIQAKVPSLTLYSYEYVATPAYNSYQTVEVVSDSSTLLTLRTKTFTNGVLTSQQDTRYRKMEG